MRLFRLVLVVAAVAAAPVRHKRKRKHPENHPFHDEPARPADDAGLHQHPHESRALVADEGGLLERERVDEAHVFGTGADAEVVAWGTTSM